MTLFENLVLNFIVLLFPILVYLLYLTFNNEFMQKENKLYLDLALLSSTFLILKVLITTNIYTFAVFLNVPLILAYLSKRYKIVLVINFLIFLIYGFNNTLIIVIIEYLLIFLTYKKFNSDTFIKLFAIIKLVFNLIIIKDYNLYNITLTVISVFMMFVLSYFTMYLFNKSNKVLNMYISLKEFEKEKKIRDSLFKITHEIKNPIAVCKSYLDMYDYKNKEHQKYIPIIKEEIDKILYLLQDFSSMSKIKIEPDIMDINMLLETIVDHFEPILKVNYIKFNYEVRQDELYINGDYNRLNQVFTNLLKNSIEAMDKQDKLIKLYTKLDNNQITIYFEDNGMGIDKDDINKIKEPFYTTKKNGTGLGVSLSCEIIEAHKGTILYRSKVGVGTKVIVTLPILKEFN